MKAKRETPDFPTLNGYSIEKHLSSGALGHVFRAKDLQKKQDVIIKVITSDHAWIKLISNREQMLSFPTTNMPKIFDVATIDGNNCIIEEYIDGSSLAQLIASRDISFAQFFAIAQDIICALSQLHKNNLIHGDVKPANVLVRKNNMGAYLIDIDSAFLHEQGVSKFFGSLLFAAPEQILENSLSASADIYSLGLLMYQIIEGRTPFRQNRSGVLEKVNGCYHVSLPNICDISFRKRLGDLINGMLQSEPKHRPRLDVVLREINTLQKLAKKHNELDHKLLITSSNIHYDNESSDMLSISHTFYTTAAITTGLCIEPDSSLSRLRVSDYQESENCYIGSPTTLEIERPPYKNSALTTISHKNFYREQLATEYAQMNKQASISFGLWVSTFIFGFIIIAIAAMLVISGQYFEALTTIVLDALVFFVQRVFAIREDFYRKQNLEKLKHLESGDYLDYILRLLDTTRDKYREKRIDTIIETIQRQIESNPKP